MLQERLSCRLRKPIWLCHHGAGKWQDTSRKYWVSTIEVFDFRDEVYNRNHVKAEGNFLLKIYFADAFYIRLALDDTTVSENSHTDSWKRRTYGSLDACLGISSKKYGACVFLYSLVIITPLYVSMPSVSKRSSLVHDLSCDLMHCPVRGG